MNITFLIGNGFDRALGLRTSYSHFYEEYCGLKSGVELIDKFRKTIDDDIKKEDEQEEKLWSDAELGLAKVTANYTLADFVTCCEDMHDRLTEYLEKQDAKFPQTDEQFEEIVRLLSSHIVEFQQDLMPTEQKLFVKIRDDDKINDTLINLVTLNYTSTCDKVFKALSQKTLASWNSNRGVKTMKMGRLVHAHGYVDNFPILGVCNPDLIEKKEYLNDPAFRALMIKKESISVVGQTWREDTYSAINNSSIICVFGASLGKSDSDYWEQIAKWLKGAESRRLIIFKFDPNVKKTNISYYQQYVKQQEVRDKFLDFTDYDATTRTKLCERIHVVINASKTFVIPEELKVKYPVAKTTHSRKPMTVLEAIEHQQQLEEVVSRTNRMMEQLDAPVLQKIQDIENKLPIG